MLMQRQHQHGRVTHLRVKHTGGPPEQNFSHRQVEQACAEGWMSLDMTKIGGETLTIKAEPADLVYSLKRLPGYYCKTTGERIPVSTMAWSRMCATGQGDLSAAEARAWLQAKGKEPNDYEVTNAYECVLDAEQHARFAPNTAEA